MDLGQSFDLTNGWNIIRILCGAFLIPHLFVKFQSQDFVKGFMAKAGLNPPIVWLYGAFAIEIVCSLGLILHVLSRHCYGCVSALCVLCKLESVRGQMDVEFRRSRVPVVLGDRLLRRRARSLRRPYRRIAVSIWGRRYVSCAHFKLYNDHYDHYDLQRADEGLYVAKDAGPNRVADASANRPPRGWPHRPP